MTDGFLPARARTIGRIVAWTLGATLLLCAMAAVWVGVRGWLAYGHLRDAQSSAGALLADVQAGTDVSARVSQIAEDTAAAHALTDDPVWQAGALLPWVGPQLHAVSTVASSIDTVAQQALVPLAGNASSLSLAALAPKDGRIQTSVLSGIADAAQSAASASADAAADVRHLPRHALVGPLRTAVEDVSDLLDETATGTQTLSRAAQLLPPMLGADGPRTYLVLFQNNAEWRSLGGIPGAMALIQTDQGGLKLVGQGSSASFPRYAQSVLPLSSEVEQLFGAKAGRFVQNVTEVPDFSVSATLAAEMWAREHGGQQVDGVISLDPVALSYLLAATGPVTLPTGDVLTSQNAVPLLLNEVYLRYSDPAAQDAFFAAAASSVFEALSRGSDHPRTLLNALARATDEDRLLVWSAHPDEQQLLTGTTLAGGLPVTDDEVATFGVYVDDLTGSKMDYYARLDSSVDWQSCSLTPSGAAGGVAALTVTIANEAPADAAGLPIYITGGGTYGVPPGIARTQAFLYLPEGFVLQTTDSTTGVSFQSHLHDGRNVVSFTTDLGPGQRTTVTLTAATSAPGAATLALRSTPTIDSSGRAPSTAVCRG